MKDNIVIDTVLSETLLKVVRKYQKGGDEITIDQQLSSSTLSDNVSHLLFNKELSIEENLNNLSLRALNSKDTIAVLFAYKEIALEIISRWISRVLDGGIESTLGQVLCALARVVSCVPESCSLTEYFLTTASTKLGIHIFQHLLNDTNTNTVNSQNILLAFYRLMSHDRHRFNHFILPDVLYGILENSNDSIIKFLSIEILCMYLDASEESRQQMINTHIPANKEVDTLIGQFDDLFDDSINYKLLALLEAKRLSNFTKLESHRHAIAVKTKLIINIKPSQLTSLVVSICGVLVPRLLDEKNKNKGIESNGINTSFVPTANSVEVLRSLATNIQKSQATMIYGPAGAGKTFLINELAQRMSYDQSIVRIHLGEQTDAKLLLGTYASGEKPGTFQWRSGVLTTAVQQGRWVIIEDIDQAPTEVLSVLLTLLEKRELTIPSRGEVIKAKNGFQLISTIRSTSDVNRLPDLIGLRLWSLVQVSSPTEIDLRNILTNRFPILGRLLPKLIGCFKEIVRIYNTSNFINLNKGSHPRVISFRDLMKLCSRCSTMLANENIESTDGLLSQDVFDKIFAETIDCFGSAITELSALLPLVTVIGEKLEIPQSRINLYMTKHVPVFINNDAMLKVGRAVLRKSSQDNALNQKVNNSGTSSFARTNHSLRLMEQIGVAIEMVEPVLLVGETGTGKTTVVQQVAKMMNKKLTVINVSQQTESGDLLGGYKPVNTKTIAVPLQEIFENLFIASFSKRRMKSLLKF